MRRAGRPGRCLPNPRCVQRRIAPTELQQLRVGTEFEQFAGVNQTDSISSLGGGETVGDDDDRAPGHQG